MPLLNDRLNAHFGSSPAFRIFDVDEHAKVVRGSQDLVSSHADCGGIPGMLKSQGVEAVIAGGIGQGAAANLARHGIALVAGAASAPCEQVIAGYLAGTLQVGPNACQGHEHGHSGGCHGHSHGHGPHHGAVRDSASEAKA